MKTRLTKNFNGKKLKFFKKNEGAIRPLQNPKKGRHVHNHMTENTRLIGPYALFKHKVQRTLCSPISITDLLKTSRGRKYFIFSLFLSTKKRSYMVEKKKENLAKNEQFLKDSVFSKLGRQDYCGIRTGFFDLDEMVGGFSKGNFFVIGSRPGIGKSAFMVNLFLGIKERHPKLSHAIYSLEMTTEEVFNRLIFADARVKSKQKENNIEAMEALERSIASIAKMKVYISDVSSISISKLISSIEFIKSTSELDIVYIDNIQLLKGSESKYNSRYDEMSDISKSLKDIAKTYQLLVVGIAQLNRKVEESKDKKPQLSDLKESGQIEQDADKILMLYDKGEKLGCVLRKNRQGKTGEFDLAFEKESGWIHG